MLFFLLLALPLQAVAEAPATKIGVVSPLTGSAASSGTTIKNSILLADQRFDTDNSVEFIFEDDQLSPKNTVSAVNKLITIDGVKGLLVFGSPTSLAVNSIAESKKTPMIALSIVDRVVNGFSFVVKLWVSAQIENDLIVQEVGRRNYKMIAVVATTNDAMLSLKSLFIDSVPNRIVANEEVNREENDLRTLATRVLSKSPDAIYNLLWAPHPSLFARAVREKGFKGPIFGVHNLEDQSEITAAGGALEHSWFVTGDDSAASTYFAEYTERYKSSPTAGGANAYDAAKLFIEGLKKADLNNFLHTVNDFQGAYGIYSATGRNDFSIGARVKYIRDGKVTDEATEQTGAADAHAHR